MIRKITIALFFVFGLAFEVVAQTQAPAPAVVAQTPVPAFSTKFSFSAKVLSVPGLSQTAVAADAGGTFTLTKNISLREDSIMVPSDNLTSYLGGIDYTIPTAKALAKTSLPANEFQFYVTGEVGIDRYTPASAIMQQHIAADAGGGLNYAPNNDSHFSVNLFEVRWARLPGVANNTVLFSSGVAVSF